MPNGVQTGLFAPKENPTKAHRSICLGKIEPRKRQGFLQTFNANVDFVGNIGDLGGPWPFDTTATEYLGHWSRSQVYQHLGEYGNLVLLSEGEAHPLVVMEALAAGLGVVVSEAAAGNLDRTYPFVSVIGPEMLTDRKFVSEAITRNREESVIRRSDIMEYARSFDWTVAASRLDATIRSIVSGSLSVAPTPSPKRQRVALITIATGGYYERFYTALRASAFQNFCFHADLEIFCFTDHVAAPIDRETLVYSTALEWPFSTLLRYNLFSRIRDRLQSFDIVAYVDADMRIEVPLSVSEFGGDFFAVEHPGFSKGHLSLLPAAPSFESDSSSVAFVPLGDRATYVQGCLFGGRAKPFLYMASKLAQEVADDLRNAQIPIWHDESYLNRFLSDHRFTLLPHVYAYPENWSTRDKPLITHLSKPHHTVRGTSANLDASNLIGKGTTPDRKMYRQLYLRSHEKTQRLEARVAVLENPVLALLWHNRRVVRGLLRATRRALSKLMNTAARRLSVLRHALRRDGSARS